MPTPSPFCSCLTLLSAPLVALPAPSQGETLLPIAFPESLHFLDVLDGTSRATPEVAAPERPDTWFGTPAFDEREGRALLGALFPALDVAAGELAELRALADDRVHGAPGAQKLAALVQAYQRGLARLDEFVRSTRWRALVLLRGGAIVVFPDAPDSSPLHAGLPDASSAALRLWPSIATPSDGERALAALEVARDTLAFERMSLERTLADLDASASKGGLLGVRHMLERIHKLAETSVYGQLNTFERAFLDVTFQEELARIERLAHEFHYGELDGLLDGGQIFLQGAPPGGSLLAYALPDVTLSSLCLEVDVSSVIRAKDAVRHVDAALALVDGERKELAATRARLEDGLRLELR